MSDFGGTFDPMADELAGGEGFDLPLLLAGFGVDEDDIDQAAVDGTLELLALERLILPETPIYTLAEVAQRSGVDVEAIRAFWRALGFPDPSPDERLFTDLDLDILSSVVFYITEGALEPEIALQMARVVGSSLERIASAQVDAIETRRAAPAGDDGDEEEEDDADAAAREVDERLAIQRGTELLPMMPKVMEFVWRRQLAAAARRRRLSASAGEGDRVCVGFADLVGFTAQTQQLAEEELAEVVARFESVAYEVVAEHGGRVVKMIGDEVMFLHDNVHDGAVLALALAETYRNDEALSDVRVGLAAGPVLKREGDVYGPVVNLASRIVSIAYPGAVVVAEDICDALGDDTTLVFKSIRQHYLKDIGRVRLYTMRHAGDEDEVLYRSARDRRAARREFLLQRRALRRAKDDTPGADTPTVVTMLDDELGMTTEMPTEEFEAITDAVLDADIDEELQVELLADIEAARRLTELEQEAERKAIEADLEAEGRLEVIEAEARRKVERIELDARRRIEEALQEAEDKAARANEEATRKVKRVAQEAERKAEQAEREARRVAKRKAAERRAAKKQERDGRAPEVEPEG